MYTLYRVPSSPVPFHLPVTSIWFSSYQLSTSFILILCDAIFSPTSQLVISWLKIGFIKFSFIFHLFSRKPLFNFRISTTRTSSTFCNLLFSVGFCQSFLEVTFKRSISGTYCRVICSEFLYLPILLFGSPNLTINHSCLFSCFCIARTSIWLSVKVYDSSSLLKISNWRTEVQLCELFFLYIYCLVDLFTWDINSPSIRESSVPSSFCTYPSENSQIIRFRIMTRILKSLFYDQQRCYTLSFDHLCINVKILTSIWSKTSEVQ